MKKADIGFCSKVITLVQKEALLSVTGHDSEELKGTVNFFIGCVDDFTLRVLLAGLIRRYRTCISMKDIPKTDPECQLYASAIEDYVKDNCVKEVK